MVFDFSGSSTVGSHEAHRRSPLPQFAWAWSFFDVQEPLDQYLICQVYHLEVTPSLVLQPLELCCDLCEISTWGWDDMFWVGRVWSHNTVDRVFLLHTADLGSISNIPYDSPSTTRSRITLIIPECDTQSKKKKKMKKRTREIRRGQRQGLCWHNLLSLVSSVGSLSIRIKLLQVTELSLTWRGGEHRAQEWSMIRIDSTDPVLAIRMFAFLEGPFRDQSHSTAVGLSSSLYIPKIMWRWQNLC